MTNVYEQDIASSSTELEDKKGYTSTELKLDPTIFPNAQLTCLNRSCVAFQEPHRSKIGFWGENGTYLGLRCLHCHTKWKDTGALFRLRETWNSLIYGFLIAASAALVVWFLPHKLLPWSTHIKWGITILCSLSAGSVLIQILQRNQRLYALRQLGYLGTPAGAIIPSEVSRNLLEQLEGKSTSIDGELKAKLRILVSALQKRAIPPLVHAKHVLALLELYPLDTIRRKIKRAGLEPDERAWVEQRLSWFQIIDANRKQWALDARRPTELLETIVCELESLAIGDKRDKEEARASLLEVLREGEELLEKVAVL